MPEITNEELRERLGELAQRVQKLEQNLNLEFCFIGILVVLLLLIWFI